MIDQPRNLRNTRHRIPRRPQGGEIMEPTQAIAPTGQTALDKLLADPGQLKDYPIETVERLFSMHKELQAETARRAFNEAFNRVQQRR